MDLLSLEKLTKASDNEISRYLEITSRPPIRRLSYDDAFHGTGLPPQPKVEYIERNDVGDVDPFPRN